MATYIPPGSEFSLVAEFIPEFRHFNIAVNRIVNEYAREYLDARKTAADQIWDGIKAAELPLRASSRLTPSASPRSSNPSFRAWWDDGGSHYGVPESDAQIIWSAAFRAGRASVGHI